MKILFGDDDKRFRDSYKRSFLRNYEVDEVANATDLINKSKIENYDLIITDNDYEDNMKGLEAIQKIRNFDTETKILFQTADLTEEAKQIALDRGANYAISKKDCQTLKNILKSMKR